MEICNEDYSFKKIKIQKTLKYLILNATFYSIFWHL